MASRHVLSFDRLLAARAHSARWNSSRQQHRSRQGRWLQLNSFSRTWLRPATHEKRDKGEAAVTITGRERLGGGALTKRWEDDRARQPQTRELSEPGSLYTSALTTGGSRLAIQPGQPTKRDHIFFYNLLVLF
jgi:hypothetical protein